jgi:TonB family protein
MGQRSRSQRFPWPAALLAAGIVSASVAAGDPSTEELAGALKNEEHTLQTLQDARTQVADPYRRIKDWRGNNLSDDLLQNVMAPETTARIQSQLQGAKEALGRRDLQATRSLVDQVATALAAEANMYKGISEYWSKWGSHAPDRSAYWDNLAKNGIVRSYVDQIDAAEARFRNQISERHFFEAMSRDYPTLNELYKRAADEESTAIALAIERGQFTPLLSKKGPATCHNPVPPTSGSEKPKFYQAGSQNEDFYPVVSRRMGESGTAHLYARVSEAGCVTEAMMTSSTGYARLDSAALDFVARARFKPAEIGGHAVARGLPFKFTFDLTN